MGNRETDDEREWGIGRLEDEREWGIGRLRMRENGE